MSEHLLEIQGNKLSIKRLSTCYELFFLELYSLKILDLFLSFCVKVWESLEEVHCSG